MVWKYRFLKIFNVNVDADADADTDVGDIN